MTTTSWPKIFAAAAGIAVLFGTAPSERVLAARDSGSEILGKFASAWSGVKTYTCMMDVHEANGSLVQDRTIRMMFSKPHDTRLDILTGDGHGGAVVWRGGDSVRAHQGGLLAGIKVSLNIDDHRVTTIRGESIAEANWGSVYDHLASLAGASFASADVGDMTIVTVSVADPPSDGGVTKEVLKLGKDSLPVEYDQYEDDVQVKHVTSSDVKLNVDIPDSTWSL